MIRMDTPGVRCCDGVTRRELLRIGGLSAAGLLLPDLLKLQARAASLDSPKIGDRGAKAPKAKRVILLFMSGGPPQQDTWDLKPDAPTAEVRGEFKPIKTNVPGIEISEQFPMLARIADKYAIIRSVTHDSNIHTVGAHAMLTGNEYPKPVSGETGASESDYPHYGAALTHLRPANPRVPAFVALPRKSANTDGTITPGQGGGFLGARYDPLQLDAEFPLDHYDPKDYMDCKFRTPVLTLPPDVTPSRFDARRLLLQELDKHSRSNERNAAVGLYDHYREMAFNLISATETQRAFDLDAEPDKVKDRYGRHLFGQGCLLARRLVAAGVPLVTVYWQHDGTPNAPCWDTHEKNYANLKDRLMPFCDRAFSALLEDLHQRGMIDDTLIVWMGEFGRTPQINKAGGRDHWGMCQSIVMAGGGVKGGQVYGKSDRMAAYPDEDPVRPGDIGATIYTLLGIPPDTKILDQTGQPHPLVRGEPISAIL